MGGALSEGTFDGQPPHLVHAPSGFRVWFIRPIGMLTQVGEQRHAGAEVARFLSVTASAELMRRRRPTERLLFIHDWRQLTGYSPEAREIMTRWGISMRDHADRIVLSLAPGAQMVKMGVSVAAVALQLVGFIVETVDDP